MIKSKHTLSYCALCESEIVKCATCNNNCCNGGYGKANGSGPGGNGPDCPDCPNAYDMQDLYWKDASAVEFAKIDDLEKLKSENREDLFKNFK